MNIRWPTPVLMTAAIVSAVALLQDLRTGAHQRESVLTEIGQPRGRVLPGLETTALDRVTIELQGADGGTIRLIPGARGGHGVHVGQEFLGVADPEALEGAFASLRMARILRNVRADKLEIGRHGAIRVSSAASQTTLELGRNTADGSGIYARSQGEETDQAWVVENELAWLVGHRVEDWLRRSLTAQEAHDVVQVVWSKGPRLLRGEDGQWRQLGEGSGARLLNRDAVDLRLARLLRAPVRHFVERSSVDPRSLMPWISLTLRDGSTVNLGQGGDCPPDIRLRLVDRGDGGRLLCVEPGDIAPWPLEDPEANILESQLLPHRYADIVDIRQRGASPSVLRRKYGRWQFGDGPAPQSWSELSEDEVYRWYRTLRGVELRHGGASEVASAAPKWTIDWELTTSSGRRLRLQCGPHEASQWLCSRDGGPAIPIAGPWPRGVELAYETFADRQLLQVPVGSLVGLEIRDQGHRRTVRQSLRLVLGAWTLDHPYHPDGDGALDETALEELSALLSGLRATAWDPRELGQPLRSIELQMRPVGDGATRASVRLYDDCRVVVDDGRAAKIGERDCARLSQDLLFDDPLRFFLRDAQSIVVDGWRGQAQALHLTREESQAWRSEDINLSPETLVQLNADLQSWSKLRSVALRPGKAGGVPLAKLAIRRRTGAPVQLRLGDKWLALTDADWHYVLAGQETP